MIVSLILMTALETAPEVDARIVACDALLREAGLTPQPQPRGSSSLLDRNPDRGEARRYLLLDRRYRGCPAPISFDVPNQPRSLGREWGRDPQPPATQPRAPRS